MKNPRSGHTSLELRSISLIASVMAICLAPGILGPGHSLVGQSSRNQKRILIDASKDGGLWWFPQASTFDARKRHQGEAFANSLRQDGTEVVELPRGAVITIETLEGFDLIIRIPAFFPYSQAEALAYRQSVEDGSRLLIIGGSTQNNDRVAQSFGLDFEKRTRFGSVKQWLQHPFTANIEKYGERAWSPVVKTPKDAVMLAWLNSQNDAPVLGYLPYGNGYVVFVGQALPSRPDSNSFGIDLANSILRTSLKDLIMIPTPDMTVLEVTLGRGPSLLDPQQDSVLPQPGDGDWSFDWEDIPDAVKYEIVILGPSASSPLVRTFTDKSEFSTGTQSQRNLYGPYGPGYIAGHNLRGWSWQVRAMLSTGIWGAWSAEGRFNVAARNTEKWTSKSPRDTEKWDSKSPQDTHKWTSRSREDCIPYDANRLTIIDEGEKGWLLSDNGGRHRMAMFDNESDAALGLEVARKHTAMCFVGRNNRRANRKTYIVQYWK